MNIEFDYSKKEYKVLDEKRIINWILKVIGKEKKDAGSIFFHIVSDDEILKINQDFLNHNYFTDIITFDTSFVNIINGEIFISFETVQSNSKKFKSPFLNEFFRVIIHGIMHLCGYNDYTQEEKSKMRYLEDTYVAYLEKI